MDKVEKIKIEVERRIAQFSRLKGNGTTEVGRRFEELSNELTSILSFIDSLEEEPVSIWHNVSRETPTGFGQAIIVLCRNKNMKDGIWLADLIQDWEGEWKPRVNWETPVKWAYVSDLLKQSNIERNGKNLQEKPVSEELEKEVNKYFNALYSGWTDEQRKEDFLVEELCTNVARHFANWQKKQDQETIELAEDHAMLAGIIKGTEHTIGNVRSILNKIAYRNNGLDVNGDYCEQPYVELDNKFRKLLKEE